MIFYHTPIPCPEIVRGYRASRVFKPGQVFTHLTADSESELIQYIESIGMKASWLQEGGTYRFHFDLTGKFLSIILKDERIIKISRREFVKQIQGRKQHGTR